MPGIASDHAALAAACGQGAGAGLCTIVGIDGSFSRRIGAQLAVLADGSVVGSLADGCLEKQLAREIADGPQGAAGQRVLRFGAGSPLIDFRLPCGSGVDILVDPAPDRAALQAALAQLQARQSAAITLAAGPLAQRHYIPALRLLLLGEGPELDALATLAKAAGHEVQCQSRDDPRLSLGRAPGHLAADAFTAIVLLFHDHEWEEAILRWALDTAAFFIGAQGGKVARDDRRERLLAAGCDAAALARIRSPIGLIPHCREPGTLAISVLAEIVAAYETLHPHNDHAAQGRA